MNDSIYVADMIVDQFEYFLNKRKIEIHNPLKGSKLNGSYPLITNLYDVDRSMLVVAVSSILEKYCSNIGHDNHPGNDKLATLDPVMYPKGGFKDDEWAESEVYIHLSDFVKEFESVIRDITPTEDDTDDPILYRIKHNMSIDSSMMESPDKGEIPTGSRQVNHL